jgi:RHS repeat-associated protein
MQAREYRPDVGRFLSTDRFEGATKDLALQSDPLTQNRYAFAGGNPVSRIEFDGHFPGYNDQSAKSKKPVYKTGRKGYCEGSSCQPVSSGSSGGSSGSAPPPSGGSQGNVALARRAAGSVGATGVDRRELVMALKPDPALSRQIIQQTPREIVAETAEGAEEEEALQARDALFAQPEGNLLDRLGGVYCGYIGACVGNQQSREFQTGVAGGEAVGTASIATGLGGAARGLVKLGVRGFADDALRAGRGADDVGAAVPRTPISGHAARRLAERGITQRQVEVAVQRGTRYYDRRNQTYSHVLDQGYASGRSLIVGTNPLTGNVTTGIRQSRRFDPNVPLPDGAPRYLPAPR